MTQVIPDDRLYSTEHEWVKIDGAQAVIGISDHAQRSLGDVVYVELPNLDQKIVAGKSIGVVESVKAVSDIFAPLSGTVRAINSRVIEHPEIINQDPFGEGWLVIIDLNDNAQINKLLDKSAYEELLAKESK